MRWWDGGNLKGGGTAVFTKKADNFGTVEDKAILTWNFYLKI